jgi:hypothetical protein
VELGRCTPATALRLAAALVRTATDGEGW